MDISIAPPQVDGFDIEVMYSSTGLLDLKYAVWCREGG